MAMETIDYTVTSLFAIILKEFFAFNLGFSLYSLYVSNFICFHCG